MKVMGAWLVFLVAFMPVHAQPATPETASVLALLQRMQAAAHTLDYAGVFTHQHGDALLSSRIVHMVDGTGERERLELLDGEPREYVRHNDATQCLMPRRKLVIRERGRSDRFPGLLIGTGETVARYYRVRNEGQTSRVAGRNCRVAELEPQDALRYGYRLCTDTQTHLLLKVQILHDGAVIDQTAFSSVHTGRDVSPTQLQSPWNTRDWTLRDEHAHDIDLNAQGWRVPAPPGYRTVMQLSRPMGENRLVKHLVLSDGLATISVFIEPVGTQPEKNNALAGTTHRRGALSIHKARVGDYALTLLGDAPPVVLQELAGRIVPPVAE